MNGIESVVNEILLLKAGYALKKENVEEKDNCCICLHECENDEENYNLEFSCCGKIIHAKCITKKYLLNCPLCKKLFKETNN